MPASRSLAATLTATSLLSCSQVPAVRSPETQLEIECFFAEPLKDSDRFGLLYHVRVRDSGFLHQDDNLGRIGAMSDFDLEINPAFVNRSS